MNLTSTDPRTPAQLRQHYEVEKELANRLRAAPEAERRGLYKVVYDERLRRIPLHPLLTRAADPQAQARAVAPQLRLIRSFVNPETVFLEIGPGDGALARAVAGYVRRVYAVDVSDGLVREEPPPPANFEFRLSDGFEVPVPPGSVHFAYSNQLMEHLHPNDAHYQLRRIYQALAPGGAYLCITPHRLSGPWDISRHFDEAATGLHLKEYTIAELAQAFHAAGFGTVKVFASSQGQVLSPLLPAGPFAMLERGLERLPRAIHRPAAQLLTAIKVMGIKGA